MGTTASVDADSDGPEVTSQQPTRRPLHHGSADHVWKKVAAIRMAAKGFKILRPGRKIDFKNVVVINKSGFSVSSLNLVAGEVVAFVWDDPEGNGYNVVQVIHDGEQFRPVPGGVYSGPVQREGHFEYLFQIEGEYKFFSSGLRCTPLTIQVSPRLDIQVELREECFYPSVIHIERGNTVKWNWQMSSVPMAMYEVQYCFRHCSTVDPPDKASIIATTTGNFKKQFKQEGVYYFQSYSSEQSAKTHYCVVHVKRVSREHKIDIMDTMFRPPILLIEEGDKVWWRWSREECRKPHCLYQVEAPELDHRSDESYIPSENGFRWPQPTKNGQMSQTFGECGIYYYSDYNDDEAAEYLGTIIVKPKQKDHLIELGADGFTPDLLRVKAGDRVWWRWEPREMGGDFALMEVEKCLCANQRTPIAEFDCDNKCRIMDDSAVHTKTLATVDTVQLNSVGVYHYRVADSPNSMATSSVIVQPGPRNYTVHVSDMDFDPKVLSINVGDRVWWVWQGTKNPHNIMQVSHRGQPIRNGFCSGAPLDAPSAYVQQFNESGVYYYISKSLPKFFGAIVVSTRPKVHELAVTHQDVDPDPTCVNLNDVVAWTFTGLKQYDVSIVTSPDQFVDLQAANNTVCPRRCLNRLMKEMPLFHHFSKSFWRSGKREMTKAELEARLSSVIVDDAHDCPVVRVSGQGFTPPKMNIVKGQSLLWSWREAGEEEHNIIHVSAPTSETPLSVIQGSQSFNSGKPVSKNSFLYTFDDVGTHCVASQGAPGYAGIVRVLDSDRRAADPVFQSDRLAGIVDPGHVVDIRCDTPGSKLYYTIDGTSPELHTLGSKPYNPQTGVVLKHPGLYVIRAIAVCDDLLQSRVVHSDRFWVLGEPDEEMTSEEEPMDVVDASDGKTHVNQWYTCRPIIKGCFIGPGILEVFWEPFSPEIKELIRGYQVFLNEVTYCDLFSADHHSLNVAGLAGGRTYEVYVEVYPNDEMLVPNRSNVLNPTVPVTAEGGGPLISLEATDDDQTMSIVWMSISSPDYPVAGYKLYLNGKQCGNMVVPDEDSNRCKVVIEECALDQLYRVAVLAIPDDSNQKPRLSNQLELSLPLETENITLPPDEYRSGDQDLYREYIEIREGAGFMPEESEDHQTQEWEQQEEIYEHKPDFQHPALFQPKLDRKYATDRERYEPEPVAGVSYDKPLYAPSSAPSGHEMPPSGHGMPPSGHGMPPSGHGMPQSAHGMPPSAHGMPQSGHGMPPSCHEPRHGRTAADLQSVAKVLGMMKHRAKPERHDSERLLKPIRRDSLQVEEPQHQSGRLQMHAVANTAALLKHKKQRQPEPEQSPLQRLPPSGANKFQKLTGVAMHVNKIDRPSSGVLRISARQNQRDIPIPPIQRAKDSQFAIQKEPYVPVHSSSETKSTLDSQLMATARGTLDSARGGVRSKSVSSATSSAEAQELSAKFYHLTREIEWLRRLVTEKLSLNDGSTGRLEGMAEEIAAVDRMLKEDVAPCSPHDSQVALPYHPGNEAYPGHYPTDPQHPHHGDHHYHNNHGTSTQPSARSSYPDPRDDYTGLVLSNRSIGGHVDPDMIEIDATHEPWSNRLKAAARAKMAISYMTSRVLRKQPMIEVTDSESDLERPSGIFPGRPRSGKGPSVDVMESPKEAVMVAEEPMIMAEKAVSRASSVPLDAALDGMGEVERLPVPKVALTPAGPDAAIVEWECAAPQPPYKCMVYVVNVVGANFNKTVNSDISKDGFECTQELDKRPVAAVQHSWNVTDNMRCPVKGLIPGETYWIHVVAHYCRHGGALDEVQIKSSTLRYTTVGSPVVPKPVVHAIHQYQVDLSWEPLEAENSHPTSGFVVLADGKPIAQLPPDETKFVLDYLQPGESKSVQVVATSDEDVGNSRPSDPIQVCCPQNPPPPRIRQEPAYKTGSVVIGWEKPSFNSTWGEDLILYTVFVDNEHHCEVKASPAADSNGYQYQFTDLPAGMTLDVHVKAVAGQLTTDPLARQILCLSESQPSNTLTVTCPAPPESPVLRIDNMTSDGVDVTWQTPQQFGDANISGFQVLKNGKLYGSTIPPEVQSMRIKDITLGEKVTLQLIALTEHPVGRRAKIVDSDSGIAGDAVIENFGACTAGPKLTFLFTGLVQAPNKVWCEQVTGHSALIVWTKDDSIRSHHVAPDSYQVTWWPGDQAENDINSQHTVNNHLEITGLEPATVYSVVVEARKLQSYSSMQQEAVMPLGNNEVDNASFLLTSHSDKLTVQVARPPDPASNLGVVASTCHSLQVAWDPPREHGVEVIGLRLDCSPVSKHHARSPTIIELLSDVTSAIIDGLCEKNEYVITVTAMTDEFFDCLEPNHELKRIRSLRSVDAVPESCWLPRTSIIASTSGTDPPSQLSLVKMTSDSVTLTWSTAAVYGSNRLLGQVVRWSDSTRLLHPTQSQQWNSEETFLASHMNLDAKDSHVTVKGLEIGTVYHFIIEAVVSVKITAEQQMDIENEGKNRRTAHVPSKPLMVRTRAPCESPKLYVTGYTQNTIQLYWEKPILYTVLQSDGDKRPKILRRHLEGYKLLINGREHLRLAPAAQTCTLSKCKPGKEYKITLVALTCTEDVRKEKRKKLRGISADSYTSVLSGPGPRELMNGSPGSQEEDDADLDEAESDVLPVTIPRALPGNIASFRASCAAVPGSSYDSSFILADWTLHGDPESVRQYNLTWCSQLNPVINRRSLGPDIHRNKVPAPDKKSVYELSINPQMYQEQTRPDEQNIQVVVAGPPDPPELFLKSVAAQEFVVEWGEPRCYGNVRVAGYQILLNDRKVGSVLNACHHKAVVPCQAHRTYRVNIIALSDTEDVEDSPKSNTVFVSTHDDGRFPAVSDRLQAAGDNDTDNMIFKVVKVTESTIQLDWSMYVDTDNVAGYRVEWSSLAQPQHKEATLGPREFSCTISKCFPGTNHFVRVMALGGNGEVVDRSRQVTVQTSAPPDTPVVNLRAVNFKYITIQWEKPQTYGDALIRGYKVFVNGIVEEEVAANQTMYSYTKGRPCCEYTFQVQALSTGGVASRHSEPLLVTLPGAKAPTLKQAAVSGNSVRVTWEKPESTEGVKCKLCKKTGSCKSCKACSGALYCSDVETGKVVQIIGPIHPDTTCADVHELRNMTYSLHLELYLHGTSDVIRSDPLLVRPAPSPDPPEITVTVVGLEERRQIEKILCNLLNRRDELLPVIQNNKGGDSELASKASEKLIQLESMIEDCFSSLTHYTGHLIAHVSWQAPQSDPEVAVAGYKVLVDGKQYGCSLHSGIRKVRIKLNLDQPTHRISMLALSDDPGAASAESNSVEVLSDPFQPFTFYCYRHVHQKDARYPSHGCCQYQCSYRVERRPGAKLVNIGHLRRHLAPPACHAREVFGGEYRPLYTPQGRATVILFWTRWCLASYKAARFFNRYAKEHAQTNDYCTVSCDLTEDPIAERQELIHLIMDNGWRDDTAIKHFTSESPGNDPEPSGKKRGFRGRDDASSILKLYNIQGVPTVVVIHPDNYVMFQGRYCAFDYSSFELWLTSAISVKDRENGVIDMDAYDMVDHDALAHRPVDSALIHTPDFTASGLAIPRGPPSPKRGGFHAHCCPAHVQGRRRKSPPTNRPRPVSSRPASRPSSHSRTSSAASKRPVSAYRKKDNISVNIRPFSATDSSKGSGYYNSPYVGPISGSVPPRPRQWKAWEP